LLTDFDISVNGIPHNLKLMYTPRNLSFIFYVVMAWWWWKWPKLVVTKLNNKGRLKTHIFIIAFQFYNKKGNPLKKKISYYTLTCDFNAHNLKYDSIIKVSFKTAFVGEPSKQPF